ncbi:MAG: hypothetical protein LBL65_05460 [Campylobacteraceae bacterium]|nr:hypothetical protein [Campylobacteraceae bacterium]
MISRGYIAIRRFEFTNFEYGWIRYQFFFLWKDESIIKDESIKKWNEYRNNHSKSAFLASSYEEDGLLLFLKELLESDKADYWTPIEPDITIAIYPDSYFPFLKSHATIIYESEKLKREEEVRKKLKKEKGKLPDDEYTFIVFVDAYNFKEADAYYGQGFLLQMIVSRQDLEIFANDLEREYIEFKKIFNIDQWNEENA